MIAAIELAYLLQKNQNALLDWLGYHWQMHQRVSEKATQQGFNDVSTYDVSMMADRGDWAYFHDQAHRQIADAFNLATPPDLSYWDEEDPTNFNNWLETHALVHDAENKALSFT